MKDMKEIKLKVAEKVSISRRLQDPLVVFGELEGNPCTVEDG